MPEHNYRKIATRRGVLFARRSLWAAPDHLLLVSRTFGFERYRRFYFHEMTALVLHRTATGRAWNAVFGVALAICVALAMLLWRSGESAKPSAWATLFALCFLVCLIWNLIAGRTCNFHLQTRGGLDRLSIVTRWRAAVKLRQKLLDLVMEPPAP